MRKTIGILCLLLMTASVIRATFPTMLYAVAPRLFAIHCINKERANSSCHGKCQRMLATQAALSIATGPALHVSPPALEPWPPAIIQSTILTFEAGRSCTLPDRAPITVIDQRHEPETPPPRNV